MSTGGPPVLEIGAVQAMGVAVQSAFGTPATTGFQWIEWKTRAIKPVTGRKLYKTGAGVRGDERKRGRAKSNTGGTFSFALQNVQGVPYIAWTWGCDDVSMATHTHTTTLNGAVSAAASSVVVTSATGFTSNTGFIQIGPDSSGRSEVHAVGVVSSTTINFANSEVLSRGYASTTPAYEGDTSGTLTHKFTDAFAPPFLTIWLNRSGQWYQVQDVQFDKLALALTGDDEWHLTFTILGGNGFTEIVAATPSFATDINELNLADLTAATLLDSVAVSDVGKFSYTGSNGVKQGWGGGSYYPTKQAPGEFTHAGDMDLYFDTAEVESLVQDTVAGTEVNGAFTIGTHTLNVVNMFHMEPDWTDTLAELNMLKVTWAARAGDASYWVWTSPTTYLPWI